MMDTSASLYAAQLWFADRLECPDCAGGLVPTADGFACITCGRRFPLRGTQLDCIVSPGKLGTLAVPLHQGEVSWPTWTPPPDGWQGPLAARTSPRQLAILAARHGRLDVLDLGCGGAEYRPLVRDLLGHRYVGLDRDGPEADVLADAHRLPFRSSSFDHVVSGAVLEHVAYPHVAVREVARVLRPAGRFSGSVAFLEPHHHASCFHLTADGLVHVLAAAGLDVVGVWPQEGWTVFDSLAEMHGPISGPTRWALKRLGALERRVRRRWWHPRERQAGRWLREKTVEELHAERLTLAGQIDFMAAKGNQST